MHTFLNIRNDWTVIYIDILLWMEKIEQMSKQLESSS